MAVMESFDATNTALSSSAMHDNAYQADKELLLSRRVSPVDAMASMASAEKASSEPMPDGSSDSGMDSLRKYAHHSASRRG